jgi:hypothetical protein
MGAGPAKVIPLQVKPGIKRDGTELEGDFYVDGQHVRFQRGLPRKMGGYEALPTQVRGPANAAIASSRAGVNTVHLGSPFGVFMLNFNGAGVIGQTSDRSPVSGSDPTRTWVFDQIYDPAFNSNNGASLLMAHMGYNGVEIDSDKEGALYAGDITQQAPLGPIDTAPKTSGGVVVLHPFVFVFGDDGFVAWSNEGEPFTWTGGSAGAARVTGAKIVAGLPVRNGGGQSPSGLLWSLDSLLKVSFIGGSAVFQFDTISAAISVMSNRSMIEYDGVFYWAGIDRFYAFNGVVRELPNGMNMNWFFDGLNFAQRQKVWAAKNPRWGEIWWFYPRGTATECTHAAIYNVRENTWYDTELPRSAGAFIPSFKYPIWADAAPVIGKDNTYRLWLHEKGTDRKELNQNLAVPSWFETSDMNGPAMFGGTDANVYIQRVEPDFVQSGQMRLNIIGQPYATGPVAESKEYFFTPDTQKIDMKEQRRQMRLRFESNVAGGDYQQGEILLTINQGDGRPG